MLRKATNEQRAEILAGLSDAEVEAFYFDWESWAREDQIQPQGEWTVWLILAGRGFGKTRIGAESIRRAVRTGYRYPNIIAATADDARDIMVQGESGILAVCPRLERPHYSPSNRCLNWPNGVKTLIFSADEPERLRGKQHSFLWCDEIAAWRYPESWDQAMFGLRLGNPRAVVTTTPRPIPIIKALIADKSTVITRGSTYANRDNLAPAFYSKIITKYEGTRVGRQELNAEVLDDNPRALWSYDMIESARVDSAPSQSRIVVGLDPNVKNRDIRKDEQPELDEAGIVVVGSAYIGAVQHFYVTGDYSLDAGPNEWAKAAVKAYSDFGADRIIGEVNNGGDMIEMVIRAVDGNVAYKSVTATRGKAIRAEPISALYEQGRVHHVGMFAKLEDEMVNFDPLTTVKSPNRMDALVWAITELSDGEGMGLYELMRQQQQPEQKTPQRGNGTTAETVVGIGWTSQ